MITRESVSGYEYEYWVYQSDCKYKSVGVSVGGRRCGWCERVSVKVKDSNKKITEVDESESLI